jgi:tetratricopeptide (TPR) repeat protein
VFHFGGSRTDLFQVRGGRILWMIAVCSAVSAGQSAGTISAWELRHPIPSKAIDFFRKTFVGDRVVENAQAMREVLRDPEVAPYALKWMGARHLDDGKVEVALHELANAVRMLPGDVEARAMYGYALYVNSKFEEAEAETGRAMALDRRQPVANITMALVVLGRFAHGLVDRPDEELLGYIRKAQQKYPAARLLLASYYQHTNRSVEARREIAAFRRSAVVTNQQSREMIERWLGSQDLPVDFGGD